MNESTVVVTGAANGIGAAVVKRYVELGVKNVIAIDRDADALNLLDCFSDKTTVVRLAIDLSNHDSVVSAFTPLLEKVGSIDVVVISHGVSDENRISESDIWNKVIDINLNSTRHLLGVLEDKIVAGGSVVVISSILGKIGKLTNTAYCTSKHGLLGLVKGLALDWAGRGIRVNAILPSWVDTPMLRREIKKQADMIGSSVEQMIRKIRRKIPLRSLVSADDVVDSVLFFTSPQSKMITAQSLVIDGGDGCGL